MLKLSRTAPSTTQVEGNTATYMGCKFQFQQIAEDSKNLEFDFIFKGSQFVTIFGSQTYKVFMDILNNFVQKTKFFSLQLVEVFNNNYTDLLSKTFKYVSVDTNFKLPQLDSLIIDTDEQRVVFIKTQLPAIIQRMTIHRKNVTPRSSFLMILKPRCGVADCAESHGTFTVLSAGEDFDVPYFESLDRVLALRNDRTLKIQKVDRNFFFDVLQPAIDAERLIGVGVLGLKDEFVMQ